MDKSQFTFDQLMDYYDDAVSSIYDLHIAGEKAPFTTFNGGPMEQSEQEDIAYIVKCKYGVEL